MLAVVTIMSIGIGIGVLMKKRTTFISFADRLITYAIWLLLFLLGLSIGTNETVVRSIGQLGVQALVISVLSVVGSVLLSYLLFVALFKDEN